MRSGMFGMLQPIQVVLARTFSLHFLSLLSRLDAGRRTQRNIHLQPCSLGLLFTSMGAGSVFGAIFVLPWTRQRLSFERFDSPGKFPCRGGLSSHGICAQPSIFMIVAALADWMDSRCI